MIRNSHIARIEEKKARKRIYLSLGILFVILISLLFGGVPLFTRLSLLLTAGGGSQNEENQSKLPLLPPRFEPLDEATNSSRLTVRGFANPGETVQLFLNNDSIDKVLVGKDGKFTVAGIRLVEGENILYGKVMNDDRESDETGGIKIFYKKSPPKLELSEPNEGQEYVGDNKELKISGKTDPDSKVTINDRFVIVDGEGNFSTQLTLHEGENLIKIISRDIAGNEIFIERKVNYKP